MAMVARAQCDVCRTEDDVQTVTVVYGRRATRSNVRPQHRMAKLPENAFTL